VTGDDGSGTLSEGMHRNRLVRLQNEKAGLEKTRSQEARKLEKLNSEVAKAKKDMLRTKSDSTRRSRARQIESKAKDAVKVQEKIAKAECLQQHRWRQEHLRRRGRRLRLLRQRHRG
jgi:hypothetical protein